MTVDLVSYDPFASFERAAFEACMVLAANANTRDAYVRDAKLWVLFCRSAGIDPYRTTAIHAAAWVEVMRQNKKHAPKTRARRLSALSSIYDWLRRNKKGVEVNPFSAQDGPKREPAHAEEPTPIVDAGAVRRALEVCEAEDSYAGVRDATIIRILWATGMRASSLVSITREKLVREGDEFSISLPVKRGKKARVQIGGKAAAALRKLLIQLWHIHCTAGEVFRMSTGKPMTRVDVWKALEARGKQVGGKLSPHSFRVAFLTLNPASVDAKQDAAGHSSPATTRLYDREWKGKEAFAMMPEIEAVVKKGKKRK